jgi:hypothetical protein
VLLSASTTSTGKLGRGTIRFWARLAEATACCLEAARWGSCRVHLRAPWGGLPGCLVSSRLGCGHSFLWADAAAPSSE